MAQTSFLTIRVWFYPNYSNPFIKLESSQPKTGYLGNQATAGSNGWHSNEIKLGILTQGKQQMCDESTIDYIWL